MIYLVCLRVYSDYYCYKMPKASLQVFCKSKHQVARRRPATCVGGQLHAQVAGYVRSRLLQQRSAARIMHVVANLRLANTKQSVDATHSSSPSRASSKILLNYVMIFVEHYYYIHYVTKFLNINTSQTIAHGFTRILDELLCVDHPVS